MIIIVSKGWPHNLNHHCHWKIRQNQPLFLKLKDVSQLQYFSIIFFVFGYVFKLWYLREFTVFLAWIEGQNLLFCHILDESAQFVTTTFSPWYELQIFEKGVISVDQTGYGFSKSTYWVDHEKVWYTFWNWCIWRNQPFLAKIRCFRDFLISPEPLVV